MMGFVWRKALTFGCVFFVFCMSAYVSNRAEGGIVNETAPLTMTFTSPHSVSAANSNRLQFLSNPTASLSAIPTSTPWPTVDPTLYATLYVTPTFTFTPTPNYYAQMHEMYQRMIGEWWGKIGVFVNRQGRKVQYSVVVFLSSVRNGTNLWSIPF